jgi:hypothetical protein
MLRNILCVAFLALTLIGAADIARSASTHLATFLAASAADAVLPTTLGSCDSAALSSMACQRRLQVASRY